MPITAQRTFDWVEDRAPAKSFRTGTFTDNMRLPVHRWFRYSAGFSAGWAEDIIRERSTSDGFFFDPFAGSGTALLSAQAHGKASVGAEPHPFVYRVARAKLAWGVDPEAVNARAALLLDRARSTRGSDLAAPPPALLSKCYSEPVLAQLETLRSAFEQEQQGDAITELLWLAITAILRECSGVGTAQWQYVLPNKSKAKVAQPYDAFVRRIAMFCDDMRIRQADGLPTQPAIMRVDDARSLQNCSDLTGKVDLVVTSPPYPNNYDYADATRLEMTFWREVSGWGDLQKTVRHRLIRSCSQHSAAEKLQLDELLEREAVKPIGRELAEVCRTLAEVRETKGGRKAYHTMVAAYFNDLALAWRALRRLCMPGADICFVIGDSAPYGVHVPAEKWLARLALAEGFSEPRFEKIRDRNLKWKNRKHQVPLQEGNLWVGG